MPATLNAFVQDTNAVEPLLTMYAGTGESETPL